MEEQKIANGGLQTVVQIAVPQIIYLDFDGELTKYDGTVLKIDRVEVADPMLSAERIAGITGELNQKFAAQNVIFVTEKPASADFSTIFIGKSDDFSAYGTFQGMAETVDLNNTNPTDNAFVLLDKTSTDQEIIATIAHEAGHLLGTLNHGGEGLQAYAAITSVTSGQTVSGITVASGDSLYISSGGVANEVTVSSGRIEVSSGGAANDVTVSGGYIAVYSGGTATNIDWTPTEGMVIILDGGSATFTSQYSGVYYGSNNQLISHADTMSGVTVSGTSALMYIYNGGTAENITVNYGGSMYISSGGVANEVTVSGGGMYVRSGGAANVVTLSGGNIYISSGGSVNDVAVSGGYITVHSGGAVSDVTVSGGYMFVYNGGTAENITVNYGGSAKIFSGGTASIAFNPWSGTIVSSAGAVVNYLERDAAVYYGNRSQGIISKGGIISNLEITSGNSAMVYESGTISGATVNSGGYMLVSSGGAANDVTLSSGYITVFSGGAANDVTVSRGYITVSSGGTASDTEVVGNAQLYVSGGTAVNNRFFGSQAYGNISNGTMRSNTVINSAYIKVYGGEIYDTLLANGGHLYVHSGSIYDTEVSGGYITVSGGSASGITLYNGAIYVSPNSSGSGKIENVDLFGGSAVISGGGTAENVLLNSNASITVSSGGTASIADNPWHFGSQKVYAESGAVVTYLNAEGVYYGNSAYGVISRGNLITDLEITSGNSVRIYSNGLLSGAMVNSGGELYIVHTYGSASDITVNGGKMFLWCGTANDVTVSSGGYMFVSHGATAENAVVSSGGNMIVYSGGTASIAFNPWSGTIVSNAGAVINYLERDAAVYYGNRFQGIISKGGIISNLEITSGNSAMVYESGTISGATVNSGGRITVLNSGTISGATVSSGGDMLISSGGTANDVTISSGLVYVYSGGMANDVTVSGGRMYVSSGGSVNDVAVSSGGYMLVYGGGAANDVTVSSGKITVSSGGTANTVTVSGGYIYVSSGGSVNDVAVYGGYMVVNSGGMATNIDWTPTEGMVYIENGGSATFTSQYSGVYYGSNNQLISHADTMSGITLSGSGNVSNHLVYVMSGGVLSDSFINHGYMYVWDGGSASNIATTSGGYIYVSSGGSVNDVAVYGGGITVHNSGTANDVTVYGGGMNVGSGGTAENITVNSGGQVTVKSGGTASIAFNPWSGTIVSSAGAVVNYLERDAEVYFGGSAQGIISKGAALSDIYIGSNLSAIVYESGSLINASLQSGGRVMNYGTVENLVVNSGGVVNNYGTLSVVWNPWGDNSKIYGNGSVTYLERDAEIYYGNTVSGLLDRGSSTENLTLAGGLSAIVYEDGVVSGADVQVGGNLLLAVGGSALKVRENGGFVSAAEGAEIEFIEHTFSNTELNSGNSATVHSRTSAVDITVNTNAQMDVFDGGNLSQLKVNGGHVNIFDGGRLDNYSVTGGWIHISGGSATNGSVTSGYVNVYNSAALENITVTGKGRITIQSGAYISNLKADATAYLGITVADNTYVEGSYGGSSFVMKDAVLNSFDLRSGFIAVSSGGTVNDITVSSGGYIVMNNGADGGQITVHSGGIVYISSGADASGITLHSGGRMYVFAGGNVENITLNAGGSVYVSSGGKAEICFNPWRGAVFASAGAAVTYLQRDNNVYYGNYSQGIVSQGNSLSALDIASGNSVIVYSNGNLADATVHAGGMMYVSSGGTASEIVEYGGYVNIADGAQVTFAEHTIDKMNLSSGHRATFHSGTTVEKLLVSSGAAAYIYNGGSAVDLHISSGGTTWIYDHGIAQSVTVHAGGNITIYSGAVVSSLDWTPCEGKVFVEDGATVNFTRELTGVYLGSNNHLIAHEMVISNSSMGSGALMYVMQNGSAVNISAFQEGHIHVSSGGLIDSATLNNFGRLFVYNGGIAENTVLNTNGLLILSGGYAENTVVNGGGMHLSSGSADKVTVHANGYLYLSSGTTATNLDIAQNAGFMVTVAKDTYAQWSSGGKSFETGNGYLADYTVGSRAYLSLMDGRMENITVENGGYIYLYHGTAENITVASRGNVIARDQAVLNSAVILEQGRLSVIGSATVNDLTLNGSAAFLQQAHINGAVIDSTGYLTIADSVLAEDISIQRGKLLVHSGATAENVLLNRFGSLSVESGGSVTLAYNPWKGYISTASGAEVTYLDACGVYVGNFESGLVSSYSGPQIKDIVITGPASGMNFSAVVINASVEKALLAARAYMLVSSGGAAYDTTVTMGGMIVFSGGVASGGSVISGGLIHVLNGGQAEALNIAKGRIMASSGAQISNITTLRGGYINVFSSAAAYDLAVSSGGILNISGGNVTNVDLHAYGSATLNSGELAGVVKVAKDAVLTVANGSIRNHSTLYLQGRLVLNQKQLRNKYNLVIDLQGALPAANDNCYVTNSVNLSDSVNIIVKVDADQAFGNYVLTDSAAVITVTAQDLTGSIAPGSKIDTLGTLSLNNTSFTAGNVKYQLLQKNGKYVLSINEAKIISAPQIAADKVEITNGDVTLSATFDAYSVKNEFSLDGTLYQLYQNPIKLSENATVYFRSTDEDDNVVETSYTVSNIDKVAPDAPVITASLDNDTPTTGTVELYAEFAADSVLNEYSFDNVNFFSYRNHVTVKENSTVYFRSKDAAGNYSVGSYAVSNITDQAPDLQVSDFYLTDYSDEKTATFQIYDDITLHFTVNNQGNTASEATVATILVDGEAYDCIDIDAIAANGSTELFYTVTSDEDWALGTHNIGIVIDAENTLLELDDGNNQTATTILLEDEYLPDLVISSIALESAETALGDTGKLLVTVRNNSFGTADISKLQIKIGNQVLDELEVGELDYYQRESFTIDIPTDGYQMGKYRIEVTADSADDLEEVSEVNNRAAIFWEVKAPDLQIVSFAAREDFFLDDQPITLEVIVRNNGNIASKATTAKIVSNDQELYVADLHELKAGESTRIEAVLAPGALAAGSHTLSLQLDNDNKAAESDENNNSQDLQLLVVLHDETKPEIIEFDLVQQKASYKFNLSTKVSDNISTSEEITTELQYAFDRSQLEQSDFTASAPPNFTAADAGKELYFRIAVRDAAGNQSISQIRSVKIADVTAPEIPEAAYSLAAQKITINYSASDNCAVTAYKIYLDDALVATTADGSWTSSVLSVGEHTFRIEALDEAGNSTSCETRRFEIGDTIAPTVTDISIKQSGNSYKFNVTLNAQDNNTAAEELKYFVKYASGAAELESAAWIDGLAFELDAAATGKSYFYSAGVMDLAGNISWSNAQQFTVLDTTAPDKISQINSVVSDDSVKISWTEVQDNTGILEYEIRCKQADGEFEYITVTGNNFDLQNLSAGEYTFNIRAYDLSGNASEWSDDCTFSIFERDPYELGNDFDTAFDLGLLKGNGSLDNSTVISNAQDVDCYKFTLSGNGNSNDWFRASAKGSDKGHLQFSLYTANGVLLEDYTQDPSGKFSLDGLFAGSYYLMVKGLNGAGGKYDLQWKCSTKVEKDAWENNNSITEASVLDLAKETGGTIYLTIDSRKDEDFFKIILPHFGSVQDYFTISFNNEISDLDLTLLDSEGDWVAESAGLGSEETISLEGLAAGTYYLRVNGSKANEYTLNYQISDGNPLPDELEGSSDPIALSGRTTYRDLSICAGDDSSDIFSFELDHVGSKNDRISFRPQNMEWDSGMKYELLDESGAVAACGTGYEVKLTDLMAGNYTLVLDTPIEGSGSKYNIKSHIRQGNEEENQSWAVFIYIDGDDQVLDGYFFKDLQKMYAAELNDNVDVYIMYDRYDMSVTDAMNHDIWENTCVGKLTNGGISWSQLGGKAEWDMSSRNTLEQFIKWGLNDSTAQNCALVIKDHGSPLGYCCSDADTGFYLNGNEKASPMLTAREIGELVGSYEQFKVTVFDACWMGSDVVINAMEGKCDYVVASEAVAWTPDISIRYKDFLESITGNMTAEEFASAAVDANGNKQQFVTMAAFYTAEKNFTNALNAFAEAAEKFTVTDWIRVANAFAAAPNYAEGHSAFSDILHIASSIKNGSEQLLSATADLIDAIKSSIVAFNAYPKSYGNGLAVLNPLQSDLDQLKDSYIGAYEGNKWNYFESDLGKGAWGEFLKKLHLFRGSPEIIKVSTAVLPGKTNIKDTAKMSVFTSYDIGVFSGEGVKLEQLAVNDTICFSLDITRDGTAGDIIRAVSENANADLSMTLYDSSMNELLSGSDSISLENIDIAANGTNYYLQVSTSEASSLTLSMHGNWTSGVDRYDYRISQSNEAGANGNGTFAKATQLTTGFYGGLVTSQDDEDIYSIGNQYFNRYTVTITAAEGLTVEEYSADGSQNLMQEAAYQNGKYILEVAAGSYLKVCGNGDLSKNEVNSYSIEVELLEGASRVSPAPAAPEVSADILHPTTGKVTVTAKFGDDAVIREYRIGNGKWLTYKKPVVVDENTLVSFRAASQQNVYCKPVEYNVVNIDHSAPEMVGGFSGSVSGNTATISWNQAEDNGMAGLKGYEFRWGTTEKLSGDGEFLSSIGKQLSGLDFGIYYYQVRSVDTLGNRSEWSEIQSFGVFNCNPSKLQSSARTLSWTAAHNAGGYIVEYSQDNFKTVLDFRSDSCQADIFALSQGTYQWRVRALNGDKWINGSEITADKNSTAVELFESDANGNMDIFFANSNGTWQKSYFAQHTGLLNSWKGTAEKVALAGKNILSDIILGSDDANLLVMTDRANGDALFMDDIFSALPGSIKKQQSRLQKIDCIRAGAGDDVVDLTSQRFEYLGSGITVQGGSGNDTIWSNNGNNILLGDGGNDRLVGGNDSDILSGGSGNDSLHGGGGEDIFVFGSNWGNDSVEQLSGGKVTLWFAEGSQSKWNSSTLVYSDGKNSVSVKGVKANSITLKFGDDQSAVFDRIAAGGAFDGESSTAIFDDKNKSGQLA